jgi:hypothetical protein
LIPISDTNIANNQVNVQLNETEVEMETEIVENISDT